MIDKLIIAGRGNCNEDENMEELLEWRIFPTATAQVPEPLEPIRAQRSERDEPQGERSTIGPKMGQNCQTKQFILIHREFEIYSYGQKVSYTKLSTYLLLT